MAGPSVRIEVEGLNEFRKELKEIDKALLKELGKAYKAIGTTIIQEAQNRAFGLGGVANKAADALSASANSTGVAIRLRGDTYPYALGAEFGGGSRPGTTQFKPYRGNGTEAGYFLYPTIRAESQNILDDFWIAFDKVSKLAFPNK